MPEPGDAPREPAARAAEADLLLAGRTVSTAQTVFHAQVAAALGLSLSDYRCLEAVLRARQPLTAGALAELAGLSTGAVTGVVDRLVRAGYVTRVRDDTDRRRVLVRAVDAAVEEHRRIFDSLAARFTELAGQFSAAELDVVRRYFHLAGEALLAEGGRLAEFRRSSAAAGARPD